MGLSEAACVQPAQIDGTRRTAFGGNAHRTLGGAVCPEGIPPPID